MDNATGTQEEQGLEHSMGGEVEHRSHVTQRTYMLMPRYVLGTNTEGHHHESDLGNRREGKYTLDVALTASYCSCIEGSEGTYPSYNVERIGCVLNPQGEQTGYLEHTCHYHRSSVNQSRYRRRTFHGIGQPNVKGEHGTLTSTTDEHQEQGGGEHHGAFSKSCLVKLEAEGMAIVTVNQDTNQEEHIGKTSDDKCLLGSGDGCGGGKVETNQEVGRYSHQFPEHIHLENIGCYHQTEH
ncbi:hypothetical protein EVA_05343 [gut metagenome]|uniref:Uncharacterized protein n=1 Tax=gut metagenome TaxID=749906 RepID=J9GGM9_9ZZZZ